MKAPRTLTRRSAGKRPHDDRARAGHGDLPKPAGEPGVRSEDHSMLVDLVVISGFSGAGKSLAMQVFEDAGYFCVDNLPPEMLRQLADLLVHDGSKVSRACVVSDTRGGAHFELLSEVLDELRQDGVAVRLLFLHADEQTLLTRYKETRRRHPLAPSGTVADGIRSEAALLESIRHRADAFIDTTGLSANALRRRITADLLEHDQPSRLAVSFFSFGHKYGPPRDADLSFDVRFLSNPHYVGDLRPKTGFDPEVVDYIAADGRLQRFYGHVLPMLDFLLPEYVAEGKSHLVVAVGCTGGRHRSVAITEALAEYCRGRGDYEVEVQHRDVRRALAH